MTAPVKKLITLNQLRIVLGDRLPHKPDHRKMMRALDLGMPSVSSPMLCGSNRMRYLFDLEAVLNWWFPTAQPKADRSAIDAALEVSARRRKSA